MSEEAKAIEAWFTSKEGMSVSDITTLQPNRKGEAEYLRNRLHRAFSAGMKAGKEIERKRIAAKLVKLIE